MNALDKCDTLIIEDSRNRLEIENDACSVIAPNLYIGRYLHFSCANTYFIGVKPQTLHIWRHHGVVYKLKFYEYESLMGEKGLSILYMAEKEENERPNAQFKIYD